MYKRNGLQREIQAYLPLHGARTAFIAKFVMAVIVVRGVTASTVASVLNSRVLPESNEKRIKRFFKKVEIESDGFARLMLALLPEKGKLVVTLDRTTWELGSTCINILMLGAAYKGLAFPLLWVLLDKTGCCWIRRATSWTKRHLSGLSAATPRSARRWWTGC